MTSEILTLQQAAKLLAITERQLRQAVRSGQIKALKLTNKTIRFHKETLMKELR